ncbi:MAG: hypothetical protein WD844_01205 [Thermoleophilaceae bacterium]
MCRVLAVSLVVLAAGAALPAAASATIFPQKSIAGIRLGISEEQVRDRLGEPSQTIRESNEFGPYIELVYRRTRLRVRLQGEEQVTFVTTSSRRERTRRGIRVGSHERSLRRNVRGVRCSSFMRFRNCAVGREEPGRTVTSFVIRRDRVARISLGIVID